MGIRWEQNSGLSFAGRPCDSHSVKEISVADISRRPPPPQFFLSVKDWALSSDRRCKSFNSSSS